MKIMYSEDNQKYYTDCRKEISCQDVYSDRYASFLNDFIPYLESKNDNEWIDVIFANSDTSKRCVIYHFLGFTGQDYPSAENGRNLEWFDEVISPISFISNQINDGLSDKYKQETPKKRVLAYLNNILTGEELTPYQMLDKFFEDKAVI